MRQGRKHWESWGRGGGDEKMSTINSTHLNEVSRLLTIRPIRTSTQPGQMSVDILYIQVMKDLHECRPA